MEAARTAAGGGVPARLLPSGHDRGHVVSLAPSMDYDPQEDVRLIGVYFFTGGACLGAMSAPISRKMPSLAFG